MGFVSIELTADGAAPALIRPDILAKAAQIGATTLGMREDFCPSQGDIDRLAALEGALEEKRRSCAPDYRPSRHVEALARLMAHRIALSRPC